MSFSGIHFISSAMGETDEYNDIIRRNLVVPKRIMTIDHPINNVMEPEGESSIEEEEEDYNESSSLTSLSLSLEAQVINKNSIAQCRMMERTKIQPTVIQIGWMAFGQLKSLVQVSFCTQGSQLREISSCAFMECTSLQVISLPDSLERISFGAFAACVNLTTVEGKLNQGITIDAFAFRKCESLSNILVPSTGTVDKRAFEGCTRLQECLCGVESVAHASTYCRFEKYPIHKLCYHSSTASVEELLKAMDNMEDEEPPLIVCDMFLMTPFHILCSCAEPRRDLFQALLQKYPSHVLGWKDTNGKRAMDYLAINWTPETASLLQMALQFWMLHPIQRWGATAWFSDMEDKVNAILVNDHKDNRAGLLRKACSKMDDHRRNESMTILELAMWNKALGSLVRRNSSISRRHLVLNTCGSSCVLSNVAPFLGFDSDY